MSLRLPHAICAASAAVMTLALSGPVWAAGGAIAGDVQKQPVNYIAIVMFLVFVAFTLGITYWAAKRTKSRKDFYAAGRRHHRLPERPRYRR